MDVITRYIVSGRLCDGQDEPITSPAECPRDAAINTECRLVAGGFHCISLSENGKVYGAGNSTCGQLARGDRYHTAEFEHIDIPRPLRSGPVHVAKVFAGAAASAAVDERGRCWIWGSIRGFEKQWNVPTPLPGIPEAQRVSQVGIGMEHVLILTKQRARMATTAAPPRFQITKEMLGTSGRVSFVAPDISPSTKAEEITKKARLVDSRCLDEDVPIQSTLWVWGHPRKHVGQLGLGETPSAMEPVELSHPEIRNVAWISVSENSSCIVRDDGQVLGWGALHDEFKSDVPKKVPVPELPQGDIIVRVRVGKGFCVMLSRFGQLYTLGNSELGQLGRFCCVDTDAEPDAVEGIEEISDFAVSTHNVCAWTVDGRLYVWGDNHHGQLGILPEEDLRSTGNKKKLKKKKSAKRMKIPSTKKRKGSILSLTASNLDEELECAHLPVRIRGEIENLQVITACCTSKAVLALARHESSLINAPLSTIVKYREPYGEYVPLIVRRCCAYIRRNVDNEGIFRVAGRSDTVGEIFDGFNKGKQVSLQQYTVHEVCTCLKRFLRELSSPVVCLDDEFLNAINWKDVHNGEALHITYNAIRGMPLENRNTFLLLVDLFVHILAAVDSNKMTTENLGIVFGPTILEWSVENMARNADFIAFVATHAKALSAKDPVEFVTRAAEQYAGVDHDPSTFSNDLITFWCQMRDEVPLYKAEGEEVLLGDVLPKSDAAKHLIRIRIYNRVGHPKIGELLGVFFPAQTCERLANLATVDLSAEQADAISVITLGRNRRSVKLENSSEPLDLLAHQEESLLKRVEQTTGVTTEKADVEGILAVWSATFSEYTKFIRAIDNQRRFAMDQAVTLLSVVELLPTVKDSSFWQTLIEEESQLIKELPKPLVELESKYIPQYFQFSEKWIEQLVGFHEAYEKSLKMLPFDKACVAVLSKQRDAVKEQLKSIYTSLQFLRTVKQKASTDCPELQGCLTGLNGMFLKFSRVNLLG